jgi:hypothetical protein
MPYPPPPMISEWLMTQPPRPPAIIATWSLMLVTFATGPPKPPVAI